MLNEPTIKRRISEWEMRRLFNEAEVEKRARIRQIKEVVVKERPVDPSSPAIGPTVPLGSKTQDVRYHDQHNNELVRAHRYIKPDGSIGASGLTDPKTIFVGNVHYHQAKKGGTTIPLTEEEFQAILDELREILDG